MKTNPQLIEIRSLARDAIGLRRTAYSRSALVGLYLGALHALARAVELGFRDRVGSIPARSYSRDLTRRLKRFGDGKLSLKRQWLAGFYFNDATFRLAALYERGLKAATGGKGQENVPCLRQIAIAKGLMSESDFRALDAVRKDINHLKHRDGLLLKGRTVPLRRAIVAAREALQLLAIVAGKPQGANDRDVDERLAPAMAGAILNRRA